MIYWPSRRPKFRNPWYSNNRFSLHTDEGYLIAFHNNTKGVVSCDNDNTAWASEQAARCRSVYDNDVPIVESLLPLLDGHERCGTLLTWRLRGAR
jgi:hypothetical protein